MPTSSYGPFVYVPNSGGGQSRVCPEMVEAIARAYALAGLSHKLVYTQGGLNDGAVAASAQVHNGLCVADLRSTNMTAAECWRVATWLLRCGVLANIRGVVDSLADHFHCVMCNPVHGHRTAQAQVTEYREGGDGLVGERPFYGPTVPFTTWERSPYNPDNMDWFDDMATTADLKAAVRAVLAEENLAAEVVKALLYTDNIPAPSQSPTLATNPTWTGITFPQRAVDLIYLLHAKVDRVLALQTVDAAGDAEGRRAILAELTEIQAAVDALKPTAPVA